MCSLNRTGTAVWNWLLWWWRRVGAVEVVARALIEHVMADHGGPLYLMCRSGLGPLYEKFGFRPVDQEDMPRYFRMISRLAAVVNRFRSTDEYLLVLFRG